MLRAPLLRTLVTDKRDNAIDNLKNIWAAQLVWHGCPHFYTSLFIYFRTARADPGTILDAAHLSGVRTVCTERATWTTVARSRLLDQRCVQCPTAAWLLAAHIVSGTLDFSRPEGRGSDPDEDNGHFSFFIFLDRFLRQVAGQIWSQKFTKNDSVVAGIDRRKNYGNEDEVIICWRW